MNGKKLSGARLPANAAAPESVTVMIGAGFLICANPARSRKKLNGVRLPANAAAPKSVTDMIGVGFLICASPAKSKKRPSEHFDIVFYHLILGDCEIQVAQPL